MALGGAPIEAIRAFRTEVAARDRLLQWLTDHGLREIKRNLIFTDHAVAACAAAWAAWRWLNGDSVWVHHAELPHHPFDFAC